MAAKRLSLVGAVSVSRLLALKLPDLSLIAALARAFAVIIDLFALYVAGHGLAELYMAQTGWQRPPVPAARRPRRQHHAAALKRSPACCI
jgi:hypothetical protein